jgi:hypothetical protein
MDKKEDPKFWINFFKKWYFWIFIILHYFWTLGSIEYYSIKEYIVSLIASFIIITIIFIIGLIIRYLYNKIKKFIIKILK